MKQRYVLCASNEGYAASLEPFKVYRVEPGLPAETARGLIRVVDESGEGYLYPGKFFMPIALPAPLRRMISRRSRQLAHMKLAA